MKTFFFSFLLFFSLSFASKPSPSWASSPDESKKQLRLLFQEARSFSQEKKFKQAQERLLEAIQLLQKMQLQTSEALGKKRLLQSEHRFWFLLGEAYKQTNDTRAAYLAFLRALREKDDAPLREKAQNELESFHSQGLRIEVAVLLRSQPSSAPITIQDIFGRIVTSRTPWRGKLPPAPFQISLAFPGYRLLQSTLSPPPDQPFQADLRLRPSSTQDLPPKKPLALAPDERETDPALLSAPSTRRPSSPPMAFQPSWGLWIAGGGLLFITLGVGIAAGVQRGQVHSMIGKNPTLEIQQANQNLILLEGITLVTLGLAVSAAGGGFLLHFFRKPSSSPSATPTTLPSATPPPSSLPAPSPSPSSSTSPSPSPSLLLAIP